MTRERLTAMRASVKDIITGRYDDNNGPCVISQMGIELRRVALVGHIVDKLYKDNYASLTLDDGTETIRLKVWGPDAHALEAFDVSDLVLVVGKVRMYQEELFVAPELLRRLDDPNFMTLHLLERYHTILTRGRRVGAVVTDVRPLETAGQTDSTATEDTGRPAVSSAPAAPEMTGVLSEDILQYIKANEGTDGVAIMDIVTHFEALGYERSEIQLEVMSLLSEGIIMEKAIGRYASL